MRQLHKATIPKIGPKDSQGPYFWLSLDGEIYLEVEAFPSSAEEEDDWYGQFDELHKDHGPRRIKLARRFLDHGGATFDDPQVRS